MLDLDIVAREFADYDLHLSDHQLAQVQTYLELLLRWNRRMNLTGLREPRRIVRELFCESMYLTRAFPLSGRLLDIGSGAGFPGLALKIALPELTTVLLEPSRRKCAFLKEAVLRLQLSGISVVSLRLAEYSRDIQERFDVATTRAVVVDESFILSVWSILHGGGRFVVFSMIGFCGLIEEIGTRFVWGRMIGIPHSRGRAILVGTKA